MREIKFRGIALWSCKWVYGYVVFDGFGAYIVPIDKPFRKEPEIPQPMNWIEVDIETVGEFTGLKDKNGKEIYEGDVVESYFTAPWDEDIPIKIKGVITFGEPFDGCFCFYDNKADNTCCLYEIADEQGCGKIIGNIYENPELL